MQSLPDSVRTPDGLEPDALDDIEQHVVRPMAIHEISIEETGDGQVGITVPISLTSENLSGRIMIESALEDMAAQLREGTVGLWDDHSHEEWTSYCCPNRLRLRFKFPTHNVHSFNNRSMNQFLISRLKENLGYLPERTDLAVMGSLKCQPGKG